MEEKAFAVLMKDSVDLMAEHAGHSDVPDDVANLLGEDVSYQLREMIMKSTAFMKKAKRRRLFPEDMNNALRDSDVQVVFGHCASSDSSPFRQTRDGELHFVEDNEISFSNAVCNSYLPKSLGKPSIKGQWISVEGFNKGSATQNTYNPHVCAKLNKKEVSDEMMGYYAQITQNILRTETVLAEWALKDLANNPNIQSLLPFFVNFVVMGMKAVSHDVSKLTLLVRTMEAIAENSNFFLANQPYLNLMTSALENCMLEPVLAYTNHHSADHWMLRERAAHLLSQIIRKWDSDLHHLQSSLVEQLSKTLQDLKRPLCSHFGAVVGLAALGSAEVEKILIPQLATLMSHINAYVEDQQLSNSAMRQDAFKVHSAIQVAVEKVMHNYIERLHAELERIEKKPLNTPSPSDIIQSGSSILALYQELSGYFGDTLSVQLPVMEIQQFFSDMQSVEDHVLLDDSESKRSGESLLNDLMQEVLQQEKQQKCKEKLGDCSNNQEQRTDFDWNHGNRVSGCVSSDDSEHLEGDFGCQEQLAVSSTISDPMKGTLKLKIKRQSQGQGSPSTSKHTMHNDKCSESEPQGKAQDRQTNCKRKRKKKSVVGNPFVSQAGGSGRGMMPLSSFSHQLSTQQERLYSDDGDDNSGSDSDFLRKGKLMLKLRVPMKDSISD